MGNSVTRVKTRVCEEEKKVISGLSNLQKQILLIALKDKNRRVEQWQILNRVYGFPVRWTGKGIRFSKADIPHALYNTRTVAVCKAFNRLEKRGLATRRRGVVCGFYLTPDGERVAREINIVGPTTTRAREKRV